jgi:GNAT superfamily N-acetyltransferase
VIDIELKRISVDSLHDFLDYFDHRAFLDDEDWAGCYCQAYLNEPNDNGEEAWAEGVARQRACDRVASGAMDGYLAYSDGRVVGWCSAGSSKLYPGVPESNEKLAVIVCLNIDPEMRRKGVAGQLMDLVIQDLSDRGFEAVEATPHKNGDASEKSFRGTLSMYQARGFEPLSDLGEHYVLMRKYLN